MGVCAYTLFQIVQSLTLEVKMEYRLLKFLWSSLMLCKNVGFRSCFDTRISIGTYGIIINTSEACRLSVRQLLESAQETKPRRLSAKSFPLAHCSCTALKSRVVPSMRSKSNGYHTSEDTRHSRKCHLREVLVWFLTVVWLVFALFLQMAEQPFAHWFISWSFIGEVSCVPWVSVFSGCGNLKVQVSFFKLVSKDWAGYAFG